MSNRDPREKFYPKLPKALLSKEIVETATVGYMLLSIQKYPVKGVCKDSHAEPWEKRSIPIIWP